MRKRLSLPLLAAFVLLFCSLSSEAQDEARLKSAIKKSLARINAAAEDVDAAAVRSYSDPGTGTEYVYLQQQYAGIKVWNHILSVAVKKGELVSSSGRFVPQLSNRRMLATPTLDRKAAVEKAAGYLGLTGRPASDMIDYGADAPPAEKLPFSEERIAKRPVEAELVWVVGEDGTTMRLCWNVSIDVRNSPDWWNVRVDARTGEFVEKENLTVYEHFAEKKKGLDNFNGVIARPDISNRYAFLPPTVTGAQYNVLAFPIESKLYGTPSVQNNPWLLAGASNNAVTNGWHFDGVNNYSITRGNNVNAYLDLANSNAPSATNRSATSSTAIPSLTFNSTPNFSVHPSSPANQDLALANLFYWNNLMHDVFYQYGFTEPAGNFQTDNLSRGGAGNDYVQAEGQDASGFNNANFNTNVDGIRPRMQMYVFLGQRTFTVNSPSAIAGNYSVAESYISPNNKLVNLGPITGQVVLYNNASNTAVACSPATNAAALAGNIALIDRSTSCSFATQLLNVQATGARAVIMRRIDGNPAAIIGGYDPSITIPAVQVTQATGNTLLAQLANNVNITLSAQNDRDGDLDNGVIAHEYGHGISVRLTGGPATASCLNNAERGGEGWSDYFALMMTTDWASAQLGDGPVPRPMGNYVLGQSPSGGGIRNFPYSTNLSVNPLTYSFVQSSGGEVHDIGEVLAAALWDMTWNIIQQQGSIEPNLYNAGSNGGNAVALRLVVEGLKLQPCSPGFIDARNAILQADNNLYGGAHRCAIWNAFARRGMGFSASQGSSNNTNDQTVRFDLPPVNISCPANQFFCFNSAGNYSVPAATTTADNPAGDNCATLSYTITGATNRSGSGGDASGAFNPGVSIITWTVDGTSQTCQTTVTVNPEITASIPDAFAMSSGVLPNTVYIGYAPASSITLTANASGGTPPYKYAWSNGSTASSITVSPLVPTTYTCTVTDDKDCPVVVSKSIAVMDIRSGNKLDKVTICHLPGDANNTLSVAASAVPAHLVHGDMLGACVAPVTRLNPGISTAPKFAVSALPNPARGYFTVNVSSDNQNEKVSVKVMDMQGRLLERREGVPANGTFRIGESYRPGVYFVEVTQGANRQQLKVTKLN